MTPSVLWAASVQELTPNARTQSRGARAASRARRPCGRALINAPRVLRRRSGAAAWIWGKPLLHTNARTRKMATREESKDGAGF